jgi:hypothetical protein
MPAFNTLLMLITDTPCSHSHLSQVESRPEGALQNPRISLANPKEFFGVKGFGFTKVGGQACTLT